MNILIEVKDTRTVANAPFVSGLAFRGFRGEQDYAAMVAVNDGRKTADQLERTQSIEDVARSCEHLVNCDLYQDMLFVEVYGRAIGYSRVWWQQELDGKRRYEHFAMLLPEWRGRGIGRAMLRHNERRLREIAAVHRRTQDYVQLFEAWAADTETYWESLLLRAGYDAVRHSFEMERRNLIDVPHFPLPEGLEVRPVRPDQHWTIWRAAEEAFQDHWGEPEWHDEWFEEWLQSPTFQPELWQVAWDGDEVAGMVLNFINYAENEEFNRARGYTEGICVRRPWRRRGLARSLIARSLRVLRERGMTEAALGVDAENPNGALQLYQSLGFEAAKQHVTYRKPLN